MSEVTRFEAWITISTILVVMSLLLPIVQRVFFKKIGYWGLLWFAIFFAGLICFGEVGDLWQAPEAYTQQVGEYQALHIDHFAVFSGNYVDTSEVRIDTDHGIYFLDGYAPVPSAGTVYAVVRQKFWGSDTQRFVCLTVRLIQCWPTRTDD
ncbi:MAG: hypothetical protein WBR29_01750 [Gammaproteobacteria bacterium]